MLQHLRLNNIVLIDRLEVPFQDGLTILTGETGAGKSILLDALGLILGKKATPKMIREGQDQASVDGVFYLSNTTIIHEILKDAGITLDDPTLIIRRILMADGRSKSFLNDQPVTLNLLSEIGRYLVDIHGQFDQLFEQKHQRDLLDTYGNLLPLRHKVKGAFEKWHEKQAAYEVLVHQSKTSQDRLLYLDFCLKELEALHIQEGEEEHLLQNRQQMMQSEKILKHLRESEHALDTASGHLHQAFKNFVKIAPLLSQEELADKLDVSLHTVQDHLAKIHHLKQAWDKMENISLEDMEHRLHALRAAARKHQTTVDALPALVQNFQQERQALQQGSQQLPELEIEIKKLQALYQELATRLYEERVQVAEKISRLVNEQLPILKLGHAHFKVQVEILGFEKAHSQGMDKVEFLVSTNKNTLFGSLKEVASGGELSRIMLALKVVTAHENQIPTLIFDEVDAGMGGSVASAVGHRLHQLSETCQVLAVTHAPQVAAYADHHYYIQKDVDQAKVTTRLTVLESEEKIQEELARMLSGKTITDSARAAAIELRTVAHGH